MYVAESRSSRVSVFHTLGQFVHSFGKRGTGRGELKGPRGIAIDEDGFVFVCDVGNNCIQVFLHTWLVQLHTLSIYFKMSIPSSYHRPLSVMLTSWVCLHV